MKNCEFCEIYADRKEIIYENKHFFSRFDLFPLNPRHVEVLPKKHIVSLMDLTNEEWAYLKPAIKVTIKFIENIDMKLHYEKILKNPYSEKSAKMIMDAINSPFINKKPDAYNHGNNDGEAAGRTIHHLHWHIMPRYWEDVEDPRGGIRHIIPSKGNYKK